jgi:hypothetical protein
MFQAKVFTSTPTILAQHADGMRVVHHQHGMVRLAEFGNLRQVGNTPLHAEHAIDHDHLTCIGTQVLQDAFEILHVVMPKFERFAKGQTTPIENTGMIEPISNDKIPFLNQGRDGHHIGLIG